MVEEQYLPAEPRRGSGISTERLKDIVPQPFQPYNIDPIHPNNLCSPHLQRPPRPQTPETDSGVDSNGSTGDLFCDRLLRRAADCFQYRRRCEDRA